MARSNKEEDLVLECALEVVLQPCANHIRTQLHVQGTSVLYALGMPQKTHCGSSLPLELINDNITIVKEDHICFSILFIHIT